MALHTIGIRTTLKTVLRLYVRSFLSLLKVVLPLVVVAEVANLLSERLNGPSIIGFSLVSWLLGTLVNIKALQLFLRQASHQATSSNLVSGPVFFFFLFITFYIGIASSLAGFLFLVPALLVYASAILAPVFVLEQGYGPFDAIAESVGQTQGNVWRISGLLLSIWVPLFIPNAVLGVLEMGHSNSTVVQVLNFLFSVGAVLLGLLTYAVMAVVYVELQPNPAVKRDAPTSGAPLTSPLQGLPRFPQVF